MREVENLKTMLALHAAISEIERVLEALPEAAQKHLAGRGEYVGSAKFDADALNAYKDSIGEENFKLLVVSPSFKDMFDEFKSKFALEVAKEMYEFIEASAKEHGISHKLTLEVVMAALSGMAHIKNMGVQKFMES